ncbi:ABC-2 type transport system ATP-binding protein [Paenibacillus sp. UNCCL117]|uniref:ABC transporter ATP-binding protein n=1 Tax=unclassified Paenibacillus TaxID=185978 RepID=UPI0008888412|nr:MULTISPECIES: ABC transporter ATP-binding protein [unclassified Paenibacillus]SDE06656.1 ABC-2 type transport system ATP-binding protein [Paenibacillus sp. cl123]SFW59353.1 ABC-2 type transport system ATP-binding protein [Paenibacillus sp. UNCCL117]
MPNEPIVQLLGVSKRIGPATIIDDLSFDVVPGEIFGFLGPNGAGKTTTIRMMVGLMTLTAGDIRIKGHSIRSSFEQAIRHVGAIVENPEMYKFLTGYQNLIHFARMVKGVTKERIDEVVRLVKLEERIHDKVSKYSLGMRQRLGVAQALLHRPSLLILDEPTNGLDPAGIRELRDYLRKLTRDEGITVIVSSHLLSEMELMCDRVAIIQRGRLVDIKPIGELVAGANVARTYRIETDAVDEGTVAAVGELDGVISVQALEAGLEIQTDRERIPDILAQLVSRQVRVYEIQALRPSLEDRFLEMTGGATHA